jgi:hypothetical protein
MKTMQPMENWDTFIKDATPLGPAAALADFKEDPEVTRRKKLAKLTSQINETQRKIESMENPDAPQNKILIRQMKDKISAMMAQRDELSY